MLFFLLSLLLSLQKNKIYVNFHFFGTDGQADKQTDRRTFRLIESIGPEGRCFEKRSGGAAPADIQYSQVPNIKGQIDGAPPLSQLFIYMNNCFQLWQSRCGRTASFVLFVCFLGSPCTALLQCGRGAIDCRLPE